MPLRFPHMPVHLAILLRVIRVSGWSGPKTRSLSGSSSWTVAVPPYDPLHMPVQYAILPRVTRVPGWSNWKGAMPAD